MTSAIAIIVTRGKGVVEERAADEIHCAGGAIVSLIRREEHLKCIDRIVVDVVKEQNAIKVEMRS
jgi:hypothetical protein